MKVLSRFSVAGLVCYCAVPLLAAPQQPAAAKPPAPAVAQPAAQRPESDEEQALRARAEGFYQAIAKKDYAAAEQLVSPDTRLLYREINFSTMTNASIDKVNIVPPGDTAVVDAIRTYVTPVPMDMTWHDHWKRVDGEWYFVAPDARMTPFGDMRTGGAPADPQAIQRAMQRQSQSIDPAAVAAAKKLAQQAAAEQAAAQHTASAAQAPSSQAAAGAPANSSTTSSAARSGKSRSKKKAAKPKPATEPPPTQP